MEDATKKTEQTTDNNSPKKVGVQNKVKESSAEYVEAKKRKAAAKKSDNKKLYTSQTTVEELTALFNDMVPTAVDLAVEKIEPKKEPFPTQEIGRRAVDRLHARIQKARDDLASQQKKETNVKKSATTKSRGTKKATKSAARGKRASFDEASKITWRGKENPFREGSGRHKRTEIVRTSNGKTVKTYLSNRGKITTLAYCIKHGLASVG